MTDKPNVIASNLKDSLSLQEIAERCRAAWDRMTPDERREMLRRQAESIARAEASWPKPRYRWENGVKIYESYEDYCNG